ncbi:NmrA family NAD(P)-binding protein [Halobacillus sp. A5]|uniref:NmrA family NAD(P)-binding protein n=1 Tax=Halobacillus sp. A5 TaxID=2880263 RepID=UPI0020A6B4F0|nr:NmrA family NAD(P)-binding protein [Halobacillus sp. A5]MCP3029279.1 NmrA family NAD(P)-binding protein [Halobacillus sp. A5]
MLITGVTGYIGRELAGCLLEKGISFRGASRHPSEAERIFNDDHMKGVRFDYDSPVTHGPAFEGVRTMFLTCPCGAEHFKSIEQALRTAKQSGIERIVFLSVLGNEKMPFLPHREIEKAIIHLGFDYTFLRASSYMHELLRSQRKIIMEEQKLRIPVGDTEVSFVDGRDVAEAAFTALLGKSYSKDTYKLTGREALTFGQVADILTEELGTKIDYESSGKHDFIKNYEEKGCSSREAEIIANYYTAVKNGACRRVSLDVGKILQREQRTMKEFVRDYHHAFV